MRARVYVVFVCVSVFVYVCVSSFLIQGLPVATDYDGVKVKQTIV